MRDYVKMLNGPNNSPVWYIEHHPMRVFKWTPDFDPFFESPIITAWCNILALPVHLFEESSLIAIGEMLGKPVQVDRATITRSRVSFARICVEVDLSRPIVEEIDINIAGKQVTLKVKWEKIPLYCNACKHVGHSAATCYASGQRPMPPKRDYTRGPPPQRGPAPNTEGGARPQQPRQAPQPTAKPSAAGGKPHMPPQQDSGEGGVDRQIHAGRRPQHPAGRMQNNAAAEMANRSVYYHGSTSTAAEGSQAAQDDGFIAPKTKRKPKSEAARQREKERRWERKHATGGGARPMSDGERDQGAEGDASSSENERGSRSLSPSHRSGIGFGPLAMVLHNNNNMFGALEDVPSDDNEVSDEARDYMVVEGDTRRMHFVRPVIEYIDQGRSSSPPLGGTPKRARHSASSTH